MLDENIFIFPVGLHLFCFIVLLMWAQNIWIEFILIIQINQTFPLAFQLLIMLIVDDKFLLNDEIEVNVPLFQQHVLLGKSFLQQIQVNFPIERIEVLTLSDTQFVQLEGLRTCGSFQILLFFLFEVLLALRFIFIDLFTLTFHAKYYDRSRVEAFVKFEDFSIAHPYKYNCEQIMDKVNDRGKQASPKKGEMTNRSRKELKKEEESKMNQRNAAETGIEGASTFNGSDSKHQKEEKTDGKGQLKVDSRIAQNEVIPGINQIDHSQRRNSSKVIMVQNRRKQRYINASTVTKSHSRLNQIQTQKQNILSELGKLDQEIALINKNQAEGNYSNFKDKMIDQEEARRKARSLIRQLKKQKEQLQQRKRRMFEKSLMLVKQEEEESRKHREERQIRLKEEKKRAIEERMEEQRRRREERIYIDKESNKLIMQLKKEDQMLKKREDTPIDLFEYEKRKKSLQKKGELNFKEIQEHQKKYLFNKENEKRKERIHTVSYPIQKYEKNIWAERLEEEQYRAKEQEKLQQQTKKERLEKKMKYSQLIKNMYSPKKIKTVQSQAEGENRSRSILPRITDSDKKMSDSKAIKQFVQEYRASLTNKANNRRSMKETKKAITQENPDDETQKRAKRFREYQIRKQTKERLKKLENQSLDLKPPSKPKYQNYLGQLKTKNKNNLASMKKILQNSHLSKQQKYDQMLKMAAQIENKAKVMQQVRREGDQSATNLYIGSIQAKIALLEQL